MRDCNGFAQKAERHFIHVVGFWLRPNLDQEIVCPLLEHSALKFSKLGRDRQTQLFETILPHIDMGRFLDGESQTGRTVHKNMLDPPELAGWQVRKIAQIKRIARLSNRVSRYRTGSPVRPLISVGCKNGRVVNS